MSYNRKYIGARYVPKFADNPQWDITNTYEPLTIVLYNNDSYTSRQYVPANISIDNTDYWIKTGNFNASLQIVEDEIQEVDEKYDAKFPVGIEDGGTGRTSYPASTLIQTNNTGTAFISLRPEQLIPQFGNTPINRAIADQLGNVINETYFNKTITYISDVNEMFSTSGTSITIAAFKAFITGNEAHVFMVFSLTRNLQPNSGNSILTVKPEYAPIGYTYIDAQQDNNVSGQNTVYFDNLTFNLLNIDVHPYSLAVPNVDDGISVSNIGNTTINAGTYMSVEFKYVFEDRSE